MKLNDNFEPSYQYTFFREKRSKYAILIPILNEGERIKRQLKKMTVLNKSTDCIIVDGGSTDRALDSLKLKAHEVRGFAVKIGPGGLSSQIRIGLNIALEQGYEGVILIDGNDKDIPSEVSRFIEKLDEGFDHIQGSRFIEGGNAINNPLLRLLAIRLLHAPLIRWRSGFKYSDTTNGFRAYSSRFLTAEGISPLRPIFNRYELHYYLAIEAGRKRFRVTEVPVTRIYPSTGKVPTKISFLRGNFEILMTLFKVVIGYYNMTEGGK